MESYIVRIYSRDPQGSSPTGIVEVVLSGEKLAFHDRNELWDILIARGIDPAEVLKPAKHGTAAKPSKGN